MRAFQAGVYEGMHEACIEPDWVVDTPIEVVMDDRPRRHSVIFTAQLWQQEDELPNTITQVASRMKDIQYASRTESHTARQPQIKIEAAPWNAAFDPVMGIVVHSWT